MPINDDGLFNVQDALDSRSGLSEEQMHLWIAEFLKHPETKRRIDGIRILAQQ